MSQVLMQFCQKELCLGSQAGLEKHTCKRLPRIRQCPATSPVAEDLGETLLHLVWPACGVCPDDPQLSTGQAQPHPNLIVQVSNLSRSITQLMELWRMVVEDCEI